MRKRWFILPIALGLVGALSGYLTGRMFHLPQIEALKDFTFQKTTIFYDRYGHPFARYATQKRELLKISQVPLCLKASLLSVEDAAFYEHGGIHFKSILRALWHDIKTRSFSQGASTLTMQLARQLFLTRKKTMKRKIEEALLALNLEKKYTKDEILEMYMNQVFLSNGVYGFATASRYYFQKPIHLLQIHEAALLAGLVQKPSRYNPLRYPKEALKRRNHCINRLVAMKYLTPKQAQAIKKRPLGLNPPKGDIAYPWFAEAVRRQVLEKYGEKTLYEKGLQVKTTLDPLLQREAQRALRQQILWIESQQGWSSQDAVPLEDPEHYQDPSWKDLHTFPKEGLLRGVVMEVGRHTAKVRIKNHTILLNAKSWKGIKDFDPKKYLKKGMLVWLWKERGGGYRLTPKPEVEGAVIVLDNRTGAVLALVGGGGFQKSQFNRATQAYRQPGSAFKPFVYAAALERGYSLADTIFDGPIYLLSETGLPDYKPENYYKKYNGIVTLRYALEHSLNVCAVKVWMMVGYRAVQRVAKRCGLTQKILPYASNALGAQEVRLIDLASAYTAFANGGIRVKPFLVKEISQGKQILERQMVQTAQALNPAMAYLITYALEGVFQRGTAIAGRAIPLPKAGKTGTTNDYTDAWFIGYTPSFTIGVWIGYDTKKPLGKRMPGGRAALPVWMKIAKVLIDHGRETQKTFPPPPDVVFSPIDATTGLKATPQCSQVILEAFLPGTEPQESCSPRYHQIASLPYYLQYPFYKPKPKEIMGNEFTAQVRELIAQGYFEKKEEKTKP